MIGKALYGAWVAACFLGSAFLGVVVWKLATSL